MEIHKERLRTIASFLDDKVRNKNFSLKVFVSGDIPSLGLIYGFVKENTCRSVSCALGLCPLVFPDDWEYNGNTPQLKINSSESPFGDARVFFGLSVAQTHVFSPDNGYYSDGDISRHTVAREIRKLADTL